MTVSNAKLRILDSPYFPDPVEVALLGDVCFVGFVVLRLDPQIRVRCAVDDGCTVHECI